MAMKEKALRRLADKLNAAGIPWAIGASWLLCQKGILDTYHDFDLFIAPEDAERADKVLSRLGMRSEATEAEGGFHAAYHFDGADIELNAWTVVNGKWHVRFTPECIAEDVNVLGAAVHLMHLEDWYVLYALMGRTSRAEAIGAYFDHQGCGCPERFERVVQEELPQEITSKIKQWVEG